MKKIYAILFYSLCPGLVPAQSVYYPLTIPYLASAKIGGVFINSINASYNPSLIPYIRNTEAMMYAEKKYLTEINVLLLSFSARFNNNGVSFLFQHSGDPLFNEQIAGLSYGKNFGIINAGVLFQRVRVNIRGSTAVSVIQTGIASSMKLNDNIYAGIKMVNPGIIKAGNNLHAASSYCFILGWQASSIAYAGFESKKEEGRPLSVVFTLHYQFGEKFSAAMNWSTTGNQPYVSISWKMLKWMLEAGCSYHTALGPSPVISLIYKNNITE
ncbi:MAG TPA: hypothetical protein VM101_12830 [Flavitalea sp.]|nr:hypothetical protein [Flavitalea sp.]